MICKLSRPQSSSALFAGWEDTIVLSCLSGMMGRIYGDNPEEPGAALAVLGDFFFFAGRPSPELVRFAEEQFPPGGILIPPNEDWSVLIRNGWKGELVPSFRYATKKDPGAFHRPRLEQAAAALPSGHHLHPIDEELFSRCLEAPWSRDLVSQYRDWETYRRLGLGVAVMTEGGELVSGASSYSTYPGGIEIEIDTHPEHRRRGLACSAGAALILACLDRGWYPSWDAANRPSLALAEKLGYRFSHRYPVFLAF